ncbi:ankyrin repeat-containing domain protein [Suillus fuscotomentosus]|uniref:Ankyrin repeat-containing domain protein n=1 Tax=Suillus fuscotomentosus TaxID=1912939 RepID=A0AAD4DND8_9AGAM|nr:ankyrin repeat-containing domain protein [Suillus fuscotomentosus]KAG1885936.1 ankyrin repeat-containing domain protein [Suillus fuscotomentosus]
MNSYTSSSVSAGHEDVVRELVGAGAEVNRKNDKGITPLLTYVNPSRILCNHKMSDDQINAKDKANQTPLHRAATTGSTGFVALLLSPPEGSTTAKLRLNTGDRIGNTPLHLAMESAHAQVAVMLIEAGADRGRTNLDEVTPENVDGVGGTEQRRAKQHVIDHCGEP